MKDEALDINLPVVYIPPGADLNFENKNKEPPKTKYENRKMILQREEVNKVTKGIYGKDGQDS